tara:strand:+ start:313 stop:510 length:198 start_codon:yes stop_codon:yes gene_type:complete
VLHVQIKVKGLQQDTLAHQDLLPELQKFLHRGAEPRLVLVLHLVRLDDDSLDLPNVPGHLLDLAR